MVAYLDLAPHKPAAEAPLTPEARAYIGNLQLSDVEMKAAKITSARWWWRSRATSRNAGDRNLDTVEIYCVFRDPYGQVLCGSAWPIVSPRMGGLKPGETKTFRLPFDNLPESWNQTMPQLVIAGVKFY